MGVGVGGGGWWCCYLIKHSPRFKVDSILGTSDIKLRFSNKNNYSLSVRNLDNSVILILLNNIFLICDRTLVQRRILCGTEDTPSCTWVLLEDI